MKQTGYMLGVDIGTTSTKAVLFSKDGTVITHHTVEYPLLTPTPLTAEQNPGEIYEAVLATIKEAIGKKAPFNRRISFAFHSAQLCTVSLQLMNQESLLQIVSLGQITEAQSGQKRLKKSGMVIAFTCVREHRFTRCRRYAKSAG
ncbi:hypothetical protein GCM10020331_015360 [Ectobacillus funiculus]